ncbi:MAG: hypothetical protein FWD38_11575 [Oscillospiraceae bacterium]|nr:hypothetical protein [Oscillospiraceae bacterium]
MLKKVLTTLILSFIVILLSGCHEEQEPSLMNSPNIVETVNETLNENLVGSETETVIIVQDTTSTLVEVIQPRATTSQPTDTPETLQTPEPSPQPTEIPKPQSTTQPATTPKPQQAQIQTATPSPMQQQPPESSPTPQESSPVSIPEPIPESTPTPVQAPEPVPKLAPEPQNARTICNTCGADITGNVPEHGTAHMLNDENFSYRVE